MESLPDAVLARVLELAVEPWTLNSFQRVCRRWRTVFKEHNALTSSFAVPRTSWSPAARSAAARFLTGSGAARSALRRVSVLGGGRELSEMVVAAGWEALEELALDAAAATDEEGDSDFGGGDLPPLHELCPRLQVLKAVGATTFREMSTLYSRFDLTSSPPACLHTVELVDLLVPLSAIDAVFESCVALRSVRLTQVTVRAEGDGPGGAPRVRWSLLPSRHSDSLEELHVADCEYVSEAEDESGGLLADAAALAAALGCAALRSLRLVALEPPEGGAYPGVPAGAWPRLEALELRPPDDLAPRERAAFRAFLSSAGAACSAPRGRGVRRLGADCVTAEAVAPAFAEVRSVRVLGWGRDPQLVYPPDALAALEKAYPCLEEVDLTRCEAFVGAPGYDEAALRALAAREGSRVRTLVLRPPPVLRRAPGVFGLRALLEALLDCDELDPPAGPAGEVARRLGLSVPGLRVVPRPVRDFRHLHLA
eukprot:tig00020807_g14069.t1